MIALMVTFALAGDVDLEDLDHWQAGSDSLLYGPPGCWELSGDGSATVVWYTPASAWTSAGEQRSVSAGNFRGVLRDGRWEDVTWSNLTHQGFAEIELEPDPIVGRRGGKTEPIEGDAPTGMKAMERGLNFVERMIDQIDPAITTSYAQWNEERTAVEFLQNVPMDDSKRPEELTVRTVFPGGGLATGLDLRFPRRIRHREEGITFTVMDAQAHVRGQPHGSTALPGVESLSLVVGVLGFTFGYEQKLVYREARRCD